MKKLFSLFVLLALCCFVVSGCDSADTGSDDGGTATESTDDGSETKDEG